MLSHNSISSVCLLFNPDMADSCCDKPECTSSPVETVVSQASTLPANGANDACKGRRLHASSWPVQEFGYCSEMTLLLTVLIILSYVEFQDYNNVYRQQLKKKMLS